MCIFFFYSQAEAVLLRDVQHFPSQIVTRLIKHDWTGERDGPLILPLKLILKLKLGNDRRKNDWAGNVFVFWPKEGRVVRRYWPAVWPRRLVCGCQTGQVRERQAVQPAWTYWAERPQSPESCTQSTSQLTPLCLRAQEMVIIIIE